MSYGTRDRAFKTSTGATIKLFRTVAGAKLLIIPANLPGPMFEKDYDHDQQWMADRDFDTIKRAIKG